MAVGVVRGPTRPAGVRLAPIDRLTLAYLAVVLAFTLAAPPALPTPSRLAALLALLAAVWVAAWLAPRARRGGRLGRLLGDFYPLLLTLGFYTQVGLLNRAAGVSHDALLQRWEQALFGGQLSLRWVRAFPSPAWSTLMHAAYLSYYAILPASPLGLWLSGRKDAARRAVLLIMAAFYLCYTASLCFPVAGPRYQFPPAANAATTVPAAALAHRLLEAFSAWGTAFPSSHVAAALVAAAAAWRGWRPLGVGLLPAALLLALSTVYGQFHYAVDALAGAAVAGVVLLVALGRQYDSAPASSPGTRRTP